MFYTYMQAPLLSPGLCLMIFGFLPGCWCTSEDRHLRALHPQLPKNTVVSVGLCIVFGSCPGAGWRTDENITGSKAFK